MKYIITVAGKNFLSIFHAKTNTPGMEIKLLECSSELHFNKEIKPNSLVDKVVNNCDSFRLESNAISGSAAWYQDEFESSFENAIVKVELPPED